MLLSLARLEAPLGTPALEALLRSFLRRPRAERAAVSVNFALAAEVLAALRMLGFEPADEEDRRLLAQIAARLQAGGGGGSAARGSERGAGPQRTKL